MTQVKPVYRFVPPADLTPEVRSLVDHLGVFIELRGNKTLVKTLSGGFRKASLLETMMWTYLLEQANLIRELKQEIRRKSGKALERERARIERVVRRAETDLHLDSRTLAFVLEIVNHPITENELFGEEICDTSRKDCL